MARPRTKRSEQLREHLDVKLTTREKRLFSALARDGKASMSAYARELIREEIARKTQQEVDDGE